jgi:hypothetical protein
MTGALTVLKSYIKTLYPVRGVCLDEETHTPQDASLPVTALRPGVLAETEPPPQQTCCNVLDNLQLTNRGFPRSQSLFSLFLDGTRQTYLVAEMASTGKRYLPVIAAQISAAVISRDRLTGRVSTYTHDHRRLMAVPGGGGGMNDGDIEQLRKDLSSRKMTIDVIAYRPKSDQDPKDSAIAKINSQMQGLEVAALENMTNKRLLAQDCMLVVDGSVQFQDVRKENLSWLKHVIGVAKSFNTHLSFLKDGTEIGAMLASQLHRIGDRTPAFRFKLDEAHQYAIWYLRIRARNQVSSPLSGIIKVEKLLVTDTEKGLGLCSDTVNNVSASLVGERYVTPYGRDDRWPNHLYPIYLAERLQHAQFLGGPHFLRLF